MRRHSRALFTVMLAAAFTPSVTGCAMLRLRKQRAALESRAADLNATIARINDAEAIFRGPRVKDRNDAMETIHPVWAAVHALHDKLDLESDVFGEPRVISAIELAGIDCNKLPLKDVKFDGTIDQQRLVYAKCALATREAEARWNAVVHRAADVGITLTKIEGVGESEKK